MDFSLSEERRLLQETIGRYLRLEYGFDSRRERMRSPEGFSRATWSQLGELGLLGIALADADGGLGGDASDTAIVMEGFGRALVVEPYLSTVVVCAGLI